MPNIYQPDLGSNPDDPFARDADGKLVRRGMEQSAIEREMFPNARETEQGRVAGGGEDGSAFLISVDRQQKSRGTVGREIRNR